MDTLPTVTYVGSDFIWFLPTVSGCSETNSLETVFCPWVRSGLGPSASDPLLTSPAAPRRDAQAQGTSVASTPGTGGKKALGLTLVSGKEGGLLGCCSSSTVLSLL